MKKNTGNLWDEPLSRPHLSGDLKENGDRFVSWSLREQLMRLLKCAGYAPLYPRLRRDAIILRGIVHGTPLAAEVNDQLIEENEGVLYEDIPEISPVQRVQKTEKA